MIAISVARPDSAPVAFASLLDFARFRIDRSATELCEACNTINSDAARFCKGCNCKLPAYYATTTSELSAWPSRKGYPLARHARGFVLTMLWVVPMMAMLVLACGLWLAGPRSAGALAVRTAQPFQALQPLAAIVSAAQPAAAEVRTVVVDPAPGDELAASGTDAAPEAGSSATSTERRAVRPSSSAQGGPAASSRVGVPRPQASCGGLNFLSHAICMNSACAQPGISRSAQCADALRQRRLDEARRNPTLVG